MHQSIRSTENIPKLLQKVGPYLVLSFLGAAQSLSAQEAIADQTVTFAEVAPILYENCIQCHNPEGGAPMSLMDYETAKIYAPLIKYRTGIKDRMGAMPPWYHERDIGLQSFKGDMSLSDDEIATLAAWADGGAPMGNPESVPPAPDVPTGWAIEPDFIVRSGPITVGANDPDWWGIIDGAIEIPLDEDRYVKAVQVREVNDIGSSNHSGRHTVGGKYIVHHAAYTVRDPNSSIFQLAGEGGGIWPVHEVGRNADIFDEDAGRLLKAGSYIVSDSVHLHSNGVDTTGHLEVGFRFHDEDYEPKYQNAFIGLGNGVDISIAGNESDQELHAYTVLDQHTKVITFEPHLHAPGERMCLEAIWGYTIETLSCVGYDHNWVRGYPYEDHAAPLLPKGTILHIVGYMNNTESNPNVPDPRNWQGSGNRSVTNMFIDLGIRVTMTDEQFHEAMEERRQALNLGPNDHVIGCPLCAAPLVAPIADNDESSDTSASDDD